MNTQSISKRWGERAERSIVLEASAIKAGNVHPKAPFEDMAYSDFLAVAEALGKTIHENRNQPFGGMVMRCTTAMLDTVRVNTSLGTILLLVPLIQCEMTLGDDFCERLLREDWDGAPICEYLSTTTAADCAAMYQAIAVSKPGGLGTSQRLDVHAPPPGSIVEAMHIAAEWDDVALQYSNGYLEVARFARQLLAWVSEGMEWLDAIRRLQLTILAERVDSHIVRKCGRSVGEQVRIRAEQVLSCAGYGTAEFEHHWRAFDQELRSGSQRKNPGTTADMIAAALYVVSSEWTD